MKNYCAYESGFFSVTLEEVTKLDTASKMNMKFYDLNLARIRKMYGDDITEFTLKDIPKNMKRAGHDSSTLLIIRRISKNYYAKRHNNSNHINLEWK